MRRLHTIKTLAASVLVGLAVPALATVVGPPGTPAAAAADSTSPTVTLDPYARPVVGSQVETHYYTESDPGEMPGILEYWQADHFLKWTASDPSGICGQTGAWQSYEFIGGDEDPVLGDSVESAPVASTARTFPVPALNLWNWGRVADRFLVRVTDCAGNTATSNVAVSEFATREDDDPGLVYGGQWRTSRFTGFSGGTTHSTTAKGASVSLTFQGSGPVALVMEKASDRGRADVFVDGVRKATVNTRSATTRHRVVVWQGLYTRGTHTLRVVNKATAGHPRIDVDTLLLCSGAIDQSSCID